MTKKILIDARFWQPKHGGLSKYTQGLIQHLARIDTTNHYLLLTSHPISQPASNFTIIPTRTPHYSLKEQFVLPFIIARHRPHLIHYLHFNHPFITPAPFIVTIHDLIKHFFPSPKDTTHTYITFKIKRLAYHLNIKHALYSAAHIITPTQSTKNIILATYPKLKKTKITPIYEGVFFSSTPPIPPPNPPNSPYLLYVGSTYQHKNLDFLLSNLHIISRYNLKLVVVTPKKPNPIYLNKLQKSPLHFYFSLPEAQLKHLYQNAYAFISASFMEGFGLPVVEALYFHKPTITTNIPTFKEITHHQQLYFDPTPQSLNQALYQLTQNYTLYQKAAQNLKNYYSFHTTAVKTLKLYKRFL